MPLHELHCMAKEMSNTCATDQSSASKNDLFELVCQNGQISVLGHSNRARKSPTCENLPSQCLPSHSPRGQHKGVGHANDNNMRTGKYWDLDIELNEITSQDKDLIPWLNYGIADSFQHEYSSEDFFHELYGVTMNELSASNTFSLLDRRNNCNKLFRDADKHSSHHVLGSEQGSLPKDSSVATVEVCTPGSSHLLYPPSSLHKSQTSLVSDRSHVVADIVEKTTSNATQHSPCGFSSSKMDRQGSAMCSNSSTMMNFSHFAKPAAVVKSNLQIIRSGSLGVKSKSATAATRSNLVESTKVDLSGECSKKATTKSHQAMEPSKVDLKPFEPKSHANDAAVSAKSYYPFCKNVPKIDQTFHVVVGDSGSKVQEAVEKIVEVAVVSSSVCSGNGAERGSNHPNQKFKRKRKSRKTENFECSSEDVEEESVGVKKETGVRRIGSNSKRNRSAEVHNLSERRRRDRINEKMRTLQELIPNCNKVMSMGTSLYMLPLMLPLGMQHMHAPHFSPMGIRMQMGNDGPYRLNQASQMQGTQVCGFPMPMPHAPMNPSTLGLNVPMENVDSASTSSLKDLTPNVNSQIMQNSNG
ncbi:hypothetical protein RJT34_19213 [Clitoria ternatea]|uniref:BHLH domain-containing protein n=1 Tax=Clitoria ternatea TaxID=43366 RepID=A0AAN9IQL5_CLITE